MVAHLLTDKKSPHTFVGPPTHLSHAAACTCSSIFHFHLLLLSSSPLPPPRRIIIMDDSNKRKRNTEPTPEDFILVGKDIQNKSGRSTGSAAEEERAFHEFFCTTAPVVTALWRLLTEHTLVPEEGMIKHLLWMLHFLRAYPKQAVACSTVGGSGGAIDPKTLRNHIWPFIEAIAFLIPDVVSFLFQAI